MKRLNDDNEICWIRKNRDKIRHVFDLSSQSGRENIRHKRHYVRRTRDLETEMTKRVI